MGLITPITASRLVTAFGVRQCISRGILHSTCQPSVFHYISLCIALHRGVPEARKGERDERHLSDVEFDEMLQIGINSCHNQETDQFAL